MSSDTEVDRREREAQEQCPCAHLSKPRETLCCGKNVTCIRELCQWPGHVAISHLADLAREYERRLADKEKA